MVMVCVCVGVCIVVVVMVMVVVVVVVVVVVEGLNERLLIAWCKGLMCVICVVRLKFRA